MFSFFGSIDFNPIKIKIVKIKSFKKTPKKTHLKSTKTLNLKF